MFTDNGNGNRCKVMTTDPMTSGSCELNRSQKYTVSTNNNKKTEEINNTNTVKPGLVTTSIKLQSNLV